MKASSFTALLSPHRQRRRPFPSIGLFRSLLRQSIEGGREGDGRHAGHFINQAPPRRRRRRLRDRQGGGRVRAGGGFATASQAFFAGAIPRSRTPRGPCSPAPNASPPRRAAGRVGRARGGAGRGRRTPADRWAPSSGPRWRARWRRRRAGRPAGEGPPDVERLRQAADAGVREPAAAESESAPIPSTAFAPPSGGCFPWANRPLRARRGRGGQAPNASPPCCESPRCARTGPARPPRARRRRAHPDFTMPMGGEDALSIRALEWGDESGRTRKGRRPAPTPLNETRFLSYKPFPSYGPRKKRGARRLRRAPRVSVVEPRGIEPLTSWLPAMRSPS